MDIFRTVSRASVASDGKLVGLFAVFGQATTRQADYAGTESIARGAFDGLLAGDTVALVNHDPNMLLGRTAAGTLVLPPTQDEGQPFEIDLPDTQLGHDVRVLVARGDFGGMSFTAQVGEVERVAGGVVHRSFKRLLDVSVVTLPAYTGTSVVARGATMQSQRGQLAVIRHRVLKGTL